ncbi:MAG TPA: glycosyltransferase family 4 protein [Gemmatimonadales bacterium]|jgi:glycosyltransferase involved in cell wall biosynthesis
MKILAVNWQDRDNPQAGGAEVHLFELLRRLVGRGHQITLVASGWPGADSEVQLDGIRVRRVGGRHSFAVRGRAAVRKALAGQAYDIVVEDINKLPLCLPTLTQLPVYVIVPHLFGATAFREAVLPVAGIVWLAERVIPLVYRRSTFHAISESTREDLIGRGIAAEAIRVIYPGVDAVAFTPGDPTDRPGEPTFLYVGRLKRYKGVETALRAVALARDRGVLLRLLVAGQGGDRARLERLTARLALGDRVEFLGFVSEDRKRELLRTSWAVLFPSPKEGWGMSNVEAAACGTPAIASDAPGLRESVRHGETGLLVPHGDPAAMLDAMLRLATDRQFVEILGRGARRFAETFSWDAAARRTERHLEEALEAGAPR